MAYNRDRVQYLIKQPRTKEVMDELIKLNMGLIGMQLKKFGLIHEAEAESAACEALYNAVRTYNDKDGMLSTYAAVCIYNTLGCYVRSLKTKMATNTVSYNAIVDSTGDEYEGYFSGDNTADGRILEECSLKLIRDAIVYCFGKVKSPMHQKVLKIWINSKFKKTHTEIAKELKCSQSYVSQIINKFRLQLKNKLKGC